VRCELVSVELGYCAGGLFEIITRDHFITPRSLV
jgi:hypothetical protein